MLSTLQEDIAHIIAREKNREHFVLVGGAALIYKKISDRTTEDLDYFTRDLKLVNQFAHACKQSIEQAGYSIKLRRENNGFVSFYVSTNDNRTVIDFGNDYFTETEDSPLGPILTEQFLGANKVLALSARYESRDGFDLHSLCKIHPLSAYIELAPEIDPGFQTWQLVRGLQNLLRITPEQSGFTKEQWEAVCAWAHETAKSL